MPLQRRVPKFGFTNPFRTEYQAIEPQEIGSTLLKPENSAIPLLSDLINSGLADDNDRIKLWEAVRSIKNSIEVHAAADRPKKKLKSRRQR